MHNNVSYICQFFFLKKKTGDTVYVLSIIKFLRMSNHCTLDLNCNLFYIYVAFIMSIFEYWHTAEVGGGVGGQTCPKDIDNQRKKG